MENSTENESREKDGESNFHGIPSALLVLSLISLFSSLLAAGLLNNHRTHLVKREFLSLFHILKCEPTRKKKTSPLLTCLNLLPWQWLRFQSNEFNLIIAINSIGSVVQLSNSMIFLGRYCYRHTIFNSDYGRYHHHPFIRQYVT